MPDYGSAGADRGKPRIGLPSCARGQVSQLQPSHLVKRSPAALDWQRVERAALPAPQSTALADPDAD